jgi:hypothetical protein
MKRIYGIIAVALFVLVVSAGETFAQLPGVAFGVRAGRNWKSKDQFAGGQVEVGFSSFTLAPNVEYYLSPKAGLKKRLDINIDGQYTLFSLAVAKLFVGGGYVISKATPDVSGASSATNKGFDVQAGAKMNLLFLHPFAMIKWEKIKKEKSVNLVIGANIGF